jgi:glycosyltransferase involved in cell wall biosynthesis
MAYLTGMRYAIDTLHADAFIEFDGDGQHDPADIPRLMAKIDAGYDYVIGSRYIAGGGVPAEWALHRRLLSRFGSLYARVLLGLPVNDVTSGLKATRAGVMQHTRLLSPDHLLSKDYAYKIQFLYEIWRSGARIAEVPILFRLREHDTSKSTWRDILESLKVTALLRAGRPRDTASRGKYE